MTSIRKNKKRIKKGLMPLKFRKRFEINDFWIKNFAGYEKSVVDKLKQLNNRIVSSKGGVISIELDKKFLDTIEQIKSGELHLDNLAVGDMESLPKTIRNSKK